MTANRRCYWGAGCQRKAGDNGYCRFHTATALLSEAEELLGKARQQIVALLQEDDERRQEAEE